MTKMLNLLNMLNIHLSSIGEEKKWILKNIYILFIGILLFSLANIT